MAKITVDGKLDDWSASDRIDTVAPVSGYSVYGSFDAGASTYYLALKLSLGAKETSIGPRTTVWLNTDMNTSSGYQVFNSSVGAEYKIEFGTDGNPALYALDAKTGATLASSTLQYKFSNDKQIVELAVPQGSLSQSASSFASGVLPGIGVDIDVNDQTFLPANYAQQYTVKIPATHIDDGKLKVGIVYSETTAAKYFSTTAYSDLFMAAQNQATMAGVPYDILSEADLQKIDTLKQYDTLIFPSFGNVKQASLGAIQSTLTDAVYKYGVSLIAAGNFMTNDETGAALAGDPYARMKSLLGVQRQGGDNVTKDDVKAAGASAAAVIGYDAGTTIHTYTETATSKVGTAYFSGVDASAQVVATQTTTGGTAPGTYNAVLATQTGGSNVFFSTEAMLADSNMLGHALDYTIRAQKAAGPELSLQMSRFSSVVATRVDMDQAMNPGDVRPGGTQPGILDKFQSVVQQWKKDYNFAGSYYIDIGDSKNGTGTNWSVSAPYYKQLIALGGEIGSHSMTHPEDTNLLTDTQLRYELQQSKASIEAPANLGVKISGFAVPGAPETLQTDERMYAAEPAYSYLTGRYSGVGAGYPGAFGYLTPSSTDRQHVFLAPNMKSDFSLVEALPQFGGGLTAAQAAKEWQTEFDMLSAHSDLPVALWTWHDYGPTAWSTGGAGSTSPYTTDMYTSFISYAYQKGGEFVTLADLAERIGASRSATFDYKYDAASNTVTANVSGGNLGNFALDLGTGYHIASVSSGSAGWYAYDDDSVFLPASLSGASYSIKLGTSASPVTHITSLPMRADLVSLSGNGRDLSFQVTGEGQVTLDLAELKGQTVSVTGATIVRQTQDAGGTHLALNLVGPETHDVSVKLVSSTAGTGSGTVGAPQPLNAPHFGTVSHDVHSPAGGVYALYDAVFDRPSDTGGQQYWTAALNSGMSLRELAETMLQSAEGRAQHGVSTTNKAFVETFYHTALHRAGDAEGVQYWTKVLDQGTARADVALSFAFSPENVASIQGAVDAGFFTANSHATDVARLYYGLLGRAPDASGLDAWTAIATSGTPLPSIARSFLGSGEYLAHFGTLGDAAFVDALYENALGRHADTGGLQSWTGLLSGGTSRADVAVSISESAEAHQHLLGKIEAGWHLVA